MNECNHMIFKDNSNDIFCHPNYDIYCDITNEIAKCGNFYGAMKNCENYETSMIKVGDKVTVLPINELDIVKCDVSDSDVYGINFKEVFNVEKKNLPVVDKTNPNYYKSQCSLECIEAMQMAFGVDAVYTFCICNAWKYMWRYENKNGFEDVTKSRWYVEKAKELKPDNHLRVDYIESILEQIEKKVKKDS